ncbi:MAG: hypothetical protein OEZ19_01420 [Paracoccaceae bacterium]|nr:hypothetical protein [Paracoccaceae bacterium]
MELDTAELLTRIARELALIRVEMLRFEALVLADGNGESDRLHQRKEVQFLDQMIQAIAQLADVLDRSAGVLAAKDRLTAEALFHNLPLRDMAARLAGQDPQSTTYQKTGYVDFF